MEAPRTDRWRRRPLLAVAVRLAVVALPISAGVGATALLAPLLPDAEGIGQLAAWWIVALAVSAGVVYLTHALIRRVSPLAVLLTLSLAFPDEAPSRLRVARAAMSTARLRGQVERARRAGIEDEPTRTAEQILALVAAVEAHDRGTRGHSERVRLYTDLLADEMALPAAARDRLRWAALLHDVGKLLVPRDVLNKAGALDDGEWDLIREHPGEGARLTEALRPWLAEWGRAIEEHHERFDGTGYPRGLGGEQISLAGRIVAVTDAFETMTAARPYRRPVSAAKARAELVRCAGTHFDPVVVRAFVGISIRRLSFLTGPLAWLAQTPLLRGLEIAAGTAGRAAAGAAAVSGALALGVAPPVDLPPEPRPAPTAHAQVLTSDAPAVPEPSRPPSARPAPSAAPPADPTPSPSPRDERSPEPSPKPVPSPTVDPSDPITPRPWPSPARPPAERDQPEPAEGPSGRAHPVFTQP